jgi:hypothetical protein
MEAGVYGGERLDLVARDSSHNIPNIWITALAGFV